MKPAFDDDTLRAFAPLISIARLFDTIPRTIGPPVPVLHNHDGEKVVFHRVRFSFARGTKQALIGERLDAVPTFQRENGRFWNWLGSKSASGGKMAGRGTTGAMMPDGTPVLGTIELSGRTLILAVTSAERAARGRALITDALGDLAGVPPSKSRRSNRC